MTKPKNMTPEQEAEWKAKRAAYNKTYYEANRERCAEYMKAYREANKESIAEKKKTRRMNARERRMIERSLLIKQAGKCACCKKPLPLDFHLDHIMPLALGGDNDANNFQALCGVCNMTKHAAHPVEHAQRMGKLL